MVSRLECCIADVSAWCASRRLQLNGDRTELLWFGSATQLRQLPSARSISVNNSIVQPVTVVRDLGVWINSELSMREHVSRVAQICFFHLCCLRSVRRRLCTTGLGSRAIVTGLLQCCPRRSSSGNSGTAAASPERSSETRPRPETTRPCNSRPS